LTVNVPTTESYASSVTYITQADGTWNGGSWDGAGARLGGRGVIIKSGAGEQDMNQFDTNFEGEFILNQGTIGVGNDQIFGGVGAASTRSQLTLNGGTLKNITNTSVNLRAPLVEMDGSFAIDVNGNNNFQFLGTANGAFHYLRGDPTVSVINSVANGTGVAIFLGQIDDGTFLGLTTTHGFTKAGPGVLTLGSNLNSYRGDTVVQEGSLRMSTSVQTNSQVVSNVGNQVTPGRIVMAGGRLEMNGQTGSVWATGITPGAYNLTRTNIENNPLHVEAPNNNSSIAYTSTTASLTEDINFVFTSNSVDWTSGTLTFLHNGTSQAAPFKPTFTGSGFNYAGPIVISNGGGTRKTILTSTNTSGTQTWSGNISGDGAYTRTGAGTTRFGGANTYTGATTVSGGELVIAQSFRSSSTLNVADGAKATMTPRSGVPDLASSRKTLQVGTLNLNTSGTLDLADNDLVVNTGSFTTIKAAVLAGFGTSGPGIISSTSDGSQILALFDNALIGAGDWNGGTIGASAVVGKYTYFGDVNFDGQVTGDDYTIIDSNLNTTPPVGLEWLSGDANLDGIVTGDDYTTIDSNLGLGTSNPLVGSALTPSSLSVVPEPALGALTMGIGALALQARRRRTPR